MKRLFVIRCLSLGVVVCLGLASGCGKNLPPMSPVSGKVTVNGQPLTAGQVALIPDVGIPTQENTKDQPTTVGLSAGTIGSDGSYKISTAGKDGAPAGKYRVSVTPSMVPSGDGKTAPPSGFNQKFSDTRNTPLKIEVPSSAAGAYDLKLTK